MYLLQKIIIGTCSSQSCIVFSCSKAVFFLLFQARNILLQSGLPQNILAQIWSLSDYDNDGRLSSEEFLLAGHLCELALKGM